MRRMYGSRTSCTVMTACLPASTRPSRSRSCDCAEGHSNGRTTSPWLMKTASSVMPSIAPSLKPFSMSFLTPFRTSNAEMVLLRICPPSPVSASAMFTSTRSRFCGYVSAPTSRPCVIWRLPAPVPFNRLRLPSMMICSSSSTTGPSGRRASSTTSMRAAVIANWCPRPWARMTLSKVPFCLRFSTRKTELRISCCRGVITFIFQPSRSTSSRVALPLVSC
mmetsp:Transcript_94786/g.244756  ORF Transcript_94786/g.244756 Transcript_94786/m.244756 type:complete len:221 (-) Transcript_94786:330-992(-)